MRIGRFDFRPALWPTLVTLLLLPLLIGLGLWQLERAAWKQDLIAAHAERSRRPPQTLAALLASGEELPYYRATARGRYDLEHQLLLDNRAEQGRAGYHVLTPLRLAGGGTVLVNRGWVPVGNDRAQLPALPGPEGAITVNAMVTLPPEKVFRLGAEEEVHPGWPQVVQQIELPALEQRLDTTLQPVILLLDPDVDGGFVRSWRPVYGISPDRHRAYALQWFTLALVLLLIYIGVNTRRLP
jgi:surfeit locus 1 family protein